jgi:hypothetical protein
VPSSNALARSTEVFSLAPQSFQEALRFADMMAASGMVPKDYVGEPGRVLAAIQYGAEIGMPPMQALQRIFVLHGKPTVDTRGCLAVVEASGYLEEKDEQWDESTMTATVTLKRRGRKPIVRTFSKADADRVTTKDDGKVCKLSEKGLYRSYPQRMYTRRALGFALVDDFSDVLGGLTPWDTIAETAGHGGEDDLRTRLATAFDAIHLTPGQQRAKLLAFRGKEPELLDWCRREYVARTGNRSRRRMERCASPRRGPYGWPWACSQQYSPFQRLRTHRAVSAPPVPTDRRPVGPSK